MYPDDSILLARGKYSTLSAARRIQLERVQKAIATLMSSAQRALRDCEEKPPVNIEPLDTIDKCTGNVRKARDELVRIGTEMELVRAAAWPSEGEE